MSDNKPATQCAAEGCAEEILGQGLCYEHLAEELWLEEGIAPATPLDPTLDNAWWGYPVEEMYQFEEVCQ